MDMQVWARLLVGRFSILLVPLGIAKIPVCDTAGSFFAIGGIKVPQYDLARTGRCKRSVIFRVESNRNWSTRAAQYTHLLKCCDVPQSYSPIIAARRQGSTVGGESQTCYSR